MYSELSLQFLAIILIETIALLIGGAISIYRKKMKSSRIKVLLSFAAGTMLYVAIVKFVPDAKELFESLYTPRVSATYLALSFFLGILSTTPIDYVLSLIYKLKAESNHAKDSDRLHWVVFSSISMHNFFEGIALFITLIGSPKLLIPVIIAIFAHNIPEGSVISVLIYEKTKSRKKALLFCGLSGLSGVVGMLMALILLQDIMTIQLLAMLKGFLAGLLINTAISELLSRSMTKGEHHLSIRFLVLGMIFMALLLILKG